MKFSEPLYLKVYFDLKEKIRNGVYPIGENLPSESELCFKHRVTRPTVRHALEKLAQEGLIIKHHGKVAKVLPQKVGLGILSMKSTSDAFNSTKFETQFIAPPTVIDFPEHFPFELNSHEIRRGAICLQRLRLLDKNPVLFERTYISNYKLDAFIENFKPTDSLFETLSNKYNIDVVSGSQKIWAIKANKEIARRLELKPNEPVLHLERKINTSLRDFYIYSVLYCNTETYYLFGEF